MTSTPIDVWNLETFDDALLAELNARRDLHRDYELTSKRNFIEQQAAKGWVPLKSNTYAAERNYVVEQVIMPAMEQRTNQRWAFMDRKEADTTQAGVSDLCFVEIGKGKAKRRTPYILDFDGQCRAADSAAHHKKKLRNHISK